MRNWIRCIGGIAGVFVCTAAVAQAEVCVTVDSEQDTLSASDRHAALLLLTRHLENAGERVVAAGCAREYRVSHVRLGDTIVVQLVGPDGRREATAQRLDDLPFLYSQMARSIVSGRPMGGFGVIDRTNVTTTQSSARRFYSDSIWYARLGHGALFGNDTYATPSLGFGYRAELDSFAIDVSFFNFQFSPGRSSWSSDAAAQTWLKLSGLYFVNPRANRSPYFGGGLSYGHQSFGGSYDSTRNYYQSSWRGSGLQGELTAGYEMARVTSVRVFVQADAVIPFYQSVAESYPTRAVGPAGVAPTTDTRRAPSLVVSIGLGR